MSRIKNPESIREILQKNLDIPNYQRPYKWKVKNVINLISDVEHEMAKATNLPEGSSYRYRIGSIILHEEDNKINIVDGQQRLLTICLILIVTAPDEVWSAIQLLKKEFSGQVTLDNLSYNLEHIERYFKNWESEQKIEFANYLLDGCEMIIIEATNIAEAFQLFDSQNARGKTLEPADLLKAYHLRSMTDEHEKRMCVQRWEESIDKKVLHPVLSRIIFRCRRWMRHDYDAYDFSNDVIDEFKGVDVDIFRKDGIRLPYMQRLYIMSQISSYSINEPIVNGKRFFDYVEHYVSIYERLFPGITDRQIKKGPEKLPTDNEQQDLIRTYCYYSPKMYRTGDSRLRNVLYCLLVAYYDKFGDEGYEDYFKIMYQYVFQIRKELSQIRKESIRDYVLKGLDTKDKRWGNQKNPFDWISDSYQAYPSELRTLLRLAETISIDELNSNVKN